MKEAVRHALNELIADAAAGRLDWDAALADYLRRHYRLQTRLADFMAAKTPKDRR